MCSARISGRPCQDIEFTLRIGGVPGGVAKGVTKGVVKGVAGIVSVIFPTWVLALAMGTESLNDLTKMLFGLLTVLGSLRFVLSKSVGSQIATFKARLKGGDSGAEEGDAR